MICISVTPESRTLAKVDLLNASRHGDIVELCLDHLIKTPDVGDLIREFTAKPIIVSCRRQEDGGQWKGSEEERLQLLRNAIIAGPAYIELDLEIADKIPRFGEVKRVVSHTKLDKPLGRIDTVFEEARKANADIVKFTWPTPTLDAAWPLLAAVSQKRELPVVGMGLGRASLTFSLLGRKFGSPWIYAALEKGMEAHEGQATVWELQDDYCWSEIDAATRFIGVVGMGDTESASIRVLNRAFREFDSAIRCLPLEIGKLDHLEKMLETLKIRGMIVGPQHGGLLAGKFAGKKEEASSRTDYGDLLLRRDDVWNSYNSLWRAVLRVTETTLGKQNDDDRPLDKKTVMILGAGPVAQAVAHGIKRRNGVLSICHPDDKAAVESAQLMEVRHVPFANVYDSLCDLAIITDPSIQMGHRKDELNVGGFLRESMTVVDISRCPADTDFLSEARERKCRVVDAAAIYADLLAMQFKSLTGKELPSEAFDAMST